MTTEELRARFARKANLTPEHHDHLLKLDITDDRPVILFDMGTDQGTSWSRKETSR